jgi:hypothetical protein
MSKHGNDDLTLENYSESCDRLKIKEIIEKEKMI